MSKRVYAVEIKKESHGSYQSYVGWDQVYTDRREALAARDRARASFYDARMVLTSRDEAERMGWRVGDAK